MKTILLDTKKNQEISVSEDTQFVLAENRGSEDEFSLNLIFQKPGVASEILGVFHLPEGGKIHLTTSSNHLVPGTSCQTYIKAVLNEKSDFDYRGEILIAKEAQQTTAYLCDNVLAVGDDVKRNSRPTLRIEANDVKASHGSTTGRIDQSELYYLESRGIGKRESEEIIIEGFLAGLIRKIKDEDVRKLVLDKMGLKNEPL
ncbi:MAG TPA: SufD family Fe-S cluster assembly protein [Candidatus Colwellbacteria bacterium]|nr:SufD family Fe-S cluster assembly protein [Candidatus Colwellbacteria bacterium]